jgi:hypothetical protein
MASAEHQGLSRSLINPLVERTDQFDHPVDRLHFVGEAIPELDEGLARFHEELCWDVHCAGLIDEAVATIPGLTKTKILRLARNYGRRNGLTKPRRPRPRRTIPTVWNLTDVVEKHRADRVPTVGGELSPHPPQQW